MNTGLLGDVFQGDTFGHGWARGWVNPKPPSIGDFIQLSAIIGDTGGGDVSKIVARDVNGTEVSGSESVTIGGSVAGNNPSGVFYGANSSDPGASVRLAANSAGGGSAGGRQYRGAISQIKIYDGVDEAQLLSSYNTAIPEPSAYALMAGALAFGLVALRRRR